MSTPDIKEGSAESPGEVMVVGDRREWRRQATGIIAGLVLAALVYLLFPSNSVETVMQSSGVDPETEYTNNAMRLTAAVTILMAVWWMTEAIPLAATALIPLVAFPAFRLWTLGRQQLRMPTLRSSSSWAAFLWHLACRNGTYTDVWL